MFGGTKFFTFLQTVISQAFYFIRLKYENYNINFNTIILYEIAMGL